MIARMAGGRPKNTTESNKVHPSLPAGAFACLKYLSDQGRLGTNVTDVARTLLIQSINNLTESGVLPPELPNSEGS